MADEQELTTELILRKPLTEALDTIAKALSRFYSEDYIMGILVKKYAPLAEEHWKQILTKMEEISLEGKCLHGRLPVLIVGINIDMPMIERTFDEETKKLPYGEENLAFYESITGQVVNFLERGVLTHDVSKWKKFIETWYTDQIKIINPHYRRNMVRGGELEPTVIYTNESLIINLGYLERELFLEENGNIGYLPKFIVNINPDDRYVFKKGEIENSEKTSTDVLSEEEQKIVNIARYVSRILYDLYSEGKQDFCSLIMPGWPLDVTPNSYRASPAWSKGIAMAAGAFMHQYCVPKITLEIPSNQPIRVRNYF